MVPQSAMTAQAIAEILDESKLGLLEICASISRDQPQDHREDHSTDDRDHDAHDEAVLANPSEAKVA